MSEGYLDRIFSRDSIREVDRLAVERYAMPSIILMENAARGIADCAIGMPQSRRAGTGASVLIVCGGGNNGGDGLAAARHLHNAGLSVTIVLARPADAYSGDAATNLRICRAMGLRLIDASDDPVAALSDLPPHDLIVEALLGTGLSSEVRPPLRDVIEWINRRREHVLAIDVPSGLDCDTGRPLGIAVEAAATITLAGVKRGMLEPHARRYVGEVHIAGIGVPRELIKDLGQPA